MDGIDKYITEANKNKKFKMEAYIILTAPIEIEGESESEVERKLDLISDKDLKSLIKKYWNKFNFELDMSLCGSIYEK